MAEEMVQKLLDGQALETEEFCDFSLEDQNEATGNLLGYLCSLFQTFYIQVYIWTKIYKTNSYKGSCDY